MHCHTLCQPVTDERALPHLPKQGSRAPWKTYQNYVRDMLTIRYGRLEDGHMRFARAGEYTPRLTHTALRREVAE